MNSYKKYTLIFKQEYVDEEMNFHLTEDPLICSHAYDLAIDPDDKCYVLKMLFQYMMKELETPED